MSDSKTCFIIMPISVPQESLEIYKGDRDHFEHVLEHLFKPAVEAAGFIPESPKSVGSDLIHAEIISQLSKADLVLCDMSLLNPNVFFELGIRTALDKPVSMVTDNTAKIPFDTGIINYHRYDSSLNVWELEKELEKLAEHIKASSGPKNNRNALWKYFGVAQTGEFRPEETTVEDKVDLLLNEIHALKMEHSFGRLRSNDIEEENARHRSNREELKNDMLNRLLGKDAGECH